MIEGNNSSVHQYHTMTLRPRGKSKEDLAGVKPLISKQPIMRIEDRLFDRGWVRSAMATRKCGNIYFPTYFMAVRPFFRRKLFQELFGLEGSKQFLE